MQYIRWLKTSLLIILVGSAKARNINNYLYKNERTCSDIYQNLKIKFRMIKTKLRKPFPYNPPLVVPHTNKNSKMLYKNYVLKKDYNFVIDLFIVLLISF